MATKQPTRNTPELDSPRLPPAVEDGTEYFESLGTFVDNLLGDRRMRRLAEERTNALFARDEDPGDPPPSESPPEVPEGTDVLTKGDPREPESR